ncbi:MAG TPA: efflux RND transporter permease subunit [Vicinamibacterales bacterium]|nr:efflux RND transporter permease subunit [Vicinamibacterales bacterium]
MNPARLAVRQSRTVLLLTLFVTAAGAVASVNLPSSIYPPLVFPRIAVIALAGTTPAVSMTLTVARPLEQAIMEVPGIRTVRSRTFRGATEISALFAPSTDMIVALQQVQGHIAAIRESLPADLELTVDRLTPSTFPMYAFNLTGGLSSAELHDVGFYIIRPALSRVPGVGKVEVLSSDTREIEVIVDPSRMLAANLTVDDVSEALKNTNLLAPAGRYEGNGLQHLVLASGLWESADQIGTTPISVKDGATIRVSDVASVAPGAPDRTTLVVGPTGDATAITVAQQVGANVLTVRAGVENALLELRRALPKGLNFVKTYDLAEFVSTAIANVRDAIIVGGVLAILVLLVFLRNWRLTIVAALTLPLTVVATFLFMWLFGESINVMSMGGLAVAIGLVIDDAVVVIENIHRRLSHGGGLESIERATQELVAPVVGSTLTTVVVFAPLGLLTGVVGQFFKALSLTLSIAVLISLLFALFLIPLLARVSARRYRIADTDAAAHEERIGLLERVYVRTLPVFLRRPILVVIALLLLAGLAAFEYTQVGTGFLPAADEGGFVIDYVAPPGLALAETDARLRKVEAVLKATPEVASFVRRTGSEMGMFATQMNTGDILVRLTPHDQRKRSAEQIIESLRDAFEEAAPDTEIEFAQLLQDMLGDLEGTPNPIEIKIFGDDQSVLEQLSEDLKPKVEAIPGVVDVVGLQRGSPEETWQVDPVAAGRLGLTVAQVTTQLSDAWLGDTTTELRLFDRTIPVRVRYPDAVRFDRTRLAQTFVRGANGKLTPALALVHITPHGSQAELMRENLRQMAIITARLEGRDLGGAVADVRKLLDATKLPVGYTFDVGGLYQSQRQAFSELLLISGIATALVFLILVVQFRKFTSAFLILLAAPMSLGGAFALLVLTGTDLNVSSAMGLILLVGLVVKNGIVLLDFAERRRAEGLPIRDAMLAAARVRLRPILMTTLCTLFGLLPLALGIGAGAELQRPLALAVIGGLSLSTLVTLYLVPSAQVALSRDRTGVELSE